MPLIQKNGGTVLANTSIVTSLPGATTAGNTILIFANGTGTITTPSGFTSRSPQVNTQGCYLFEKLAASGNSSDTPTLTMSGAYTATWQIVEYSNITAFDTSSGNNSGATGHGFWNTPSITPASGNKRLVAFVVASNTSSTTFTAGDPQGFGSGFTDQQSNVRNGQASPAGQDTTAGGFADRVAVASGGSFASGATLTNSATTMAPASIIAAYTTTDGPAAGSSPPSFRSHTAINYASRTNTTVSAPAGLADGDILLLSVIFGNTTQGALPTPTWPTGFVEIDSTEVAQGGLTFWGKFRIAWKRAASESGSYTITHATSNTNAMLAAYSGCIATGSPIDVYSKRWGSAVAGGDAVGVTATANSVTTTVDYTKLVFSSHDWDGTGTLSPPTGMAERYDSLVYVSDEDQVIAGATGTRSHTTGSTNPWAAFLIALKPVPAGGGVTHYTMPAATGAFSLAGQLATLRYGHKLPGGVGAFTLAGQAATLRYGHKIPAATGAFALAGQAATLRYGHKLPAVTGAFTIAGQVAGLRTARKMPAITGPFTIAGQAAGLRLGRKTGAATGPFTIVGAPAGLLYSGTSNKVLPASTGAFTIAGQDAGLRYVRKIKMPAVTGAFTIAGQAATLAYGRKMPAAVRTFAIAGQAAVLRYRKGLAAYPGAFLVNGQPVTLIYNQKLAYVMNAEPGAFYVNSIWANVGSTHVAQPGPLHFGRRATIRRW